jgi:CubicO group peptidase (beta-lactamase class C family)
VDFDELCMGRILRPLGMTHSGYRLADIHSSNVAMPYSRTQNDFEPIFQYGYPDYPDYPDGALRTRATTSSATRAATTARARGCSSGPTGASASCH